MALCTAAPSALSLILTVKSTPFRAWLLTVGPSGLEDFQRCWVQSDFLYKAIPSRDPSEEQTPQLLLTEDHRGLDDLLAARIITLDGGDTATLLNRLPSGFATGWEMSNT